MMKQQASLITTAFLGLVLSVLVGCSGALPGTGNPTKNQLPNLSGSYNQYEGEELLESGTQAAILASLFGGQPQFVPLAAAINQIGGCAQEKGAANWRAYVQKDDITAAGVVLVASQNQMTSPSVIFDCATSGKAGKTAGEGPTFCTKTYSYEANDDTYYVMYAGSQERVCTDFCQALQGCTP